MVSFDEVKDQTTEEYFNNNKFSIDAFNKKYAAFDGETYIRALKRVCDYVASVESTEELRRYWSERWFDEIYNDWWHPAGSIMQGAGIDRKVSLANCTTISLGNVGGDDEEWDNLESIIKNTAYTVAKCAAYRQGLGVDFSRVRPAHAKVLNSANESTGAIHWMKFIDSIGYYVGQKGRIPAMLFSINIKHPDVEEFITVKSDYTKIQNANISVQITNDFYDAVFNDSDWQLEFNIPAVKKGQKVYIDAHSIDKDCEFEPAGGATMSGRWYYIAKQDRSAESIIKTVKARYLLELIAKYMTENAEPGIQNIDVARKYSNSDYVDDPASGYCAKICSTNACCLTADTVVMTNKGWFSLGELFEKINNGEVFLALSYNIKDETFEFKEVLNAWQQRNDITVELTIEENGNIYKVECSADHPFLTKNRGYVEAAQINSEDDIVIFQG